MADESGLFGGFFQDPQKAAALGMLMSALNPYGKDQTSAMIQMLALKGKQNEQKSDRTAMELALTQAGLDPTAAKALASNPEAAKLAVQQKQLAGERAADSSIMSGLGAAPATMPPATTPDASLPRGIRNNNPLNIESGSFTQSQPGYAGSDGRFAKFASADQGVAAADRLLGVYNSKHGLNTVAGIIGRWAPASDGNPVSAYAKSVADELGVKPTDPIDMSDPAVRQKLIGAMGKFENGRPIDMKAPVVAQGGEEPQNQPTRRPAQYYMDLLAKYPNASQSTKTMLRQMAEKAMQDDAPTEERKNYNFYRQDGGKLGFQEWMERKAKGPSESEKVSERERIAIEVLGLKKGSPQYQSYVGTGKLGRDEPLSATDRKAIASAEDELPNLQQTVELLNRAKELNGKTFTGYTAGIRGQIGSKIPGAGYVIDQSAAKDTLEFENLMSTEAVTTMANTLKGATTDFELREFKARLSDPATPPEIRGRIIDRMKTLAERQLKINIDRLNQLREGEYYKPGGGASAKPGEKPKLEDPLGIR